MRQRKTIVAVAVFAALVTAGTLIDTRPVQAFNDNNGAQDEKEMIRTGLEVAPAIGVRLNMTGKDPDMSDWAATWSMWPATATVAIRTRRPPICRAATRTFAPRILQYSQARGRSTPQLTSEATRTSACFQAPAVRCTSSPAT